VNQFSLLLRVDAPPGADGAPPMLSAASQALRARLYRELGLKARSVAWVTITPGTTKGDAVVERLIEERLAGRAFVGAATLTEVITDAERADSAWSLVATRTVDDFSLWDEYPGGKVGTLPAVHALNHTFVSTAFVGSWRRHGLTGASFLTCASRGRKPGAPWFLALPDHSLGRGLDHPWFARPAWRRDVAGRPDRRTSALDVGQSAFHQQWLRPDAASNPMLASLLRLCPPPAAYTSGLDGLQLVTVPRYWAGALPPGDAAYLPWGEDGPNRAGKMLRFRQLAVSARARRALIADGLFAASAFLPLRVIHDVAPGEVLDRPGDPVPPMFTADELAALGAREPAVVAENSRRR